VKTVGQGVALGGVAAAVGGAGLYIVDDKFRAHVDDTLKAIGDWFKENFDW
jgi:hypothetical protein